MTYRELYGKGCAALEAAGVEEAALDARLLIEYVCDTTRNDLLVHGERLIEREQEEKYRQLIAKRASRIPLQHLTGNQDFMGLTFRVNEHVLIPRQDTEILAEEALRYLHDGMEILDMCTGSGCILLSLLHYSNGCRGVGVDLSAEALAVARENAERTGRMDEGGKEALNCRFVQSNLFQNVEGKYDMIVSNPPYIPTEAISGLMEEVRDYEPIGALDGKEDGLFFYREITSQAFGFLRGGGYLFFETGYDQAEAVKDIMEQAGYREITIVRDYAGLDRVVYGWKQAG